jgi:DNA adenine methylase
MKKPYKTYNGGKNGSGVYQQIINQIPPHKIFISGFAGNCGVLANKLPASMANIAIDVDVKITDAWSRIKNIETINQDCITFINDYLRVTLLFNTTSFKDIFIFLDPPYLKQVRAGNKNLYRYTMDSEPEHEKLLQAALTWPVKIMFTHYPCELYDKILNNWRVKDIKAMSHIGLRTERLYMNYPESSELHDYRYLGEDFRERELYKKMRSNMVNKFKRMNDLERNMIIEALNTAGLIHKPDTGLQHK